MTEFRFPSEGEVPALRQLWREAFGESEAFLNLFFSAAYDPGRCFVAVEGGVLGAMLYWFDCEYRGEKVAYLYGIATAKSHRGRGLATALMEKAQAHLEKRGYAFSLLVPARESLFRFYGQRGYEIVGYLKEMIVTAGKPIPIREVTAAEYAQLRRMLLPPGAIMQEGANLRLLAGYSRFYGGEGWCAVVSSGEKPIVTELLGEDGAAQGLLAALEIPEAVVRCPGGDKPFAMAKALAGTVPERVYFGFAFD